jgi:hypothetical protein
VPWRSRRPAVTTCSCRNLFRGCRRGPRLVPSDGMEYTAGRCVRVGPNIPSPSPLAPYRKALIRRLPEPISGFDSKECVWSDRSRAGLERRLDRNGAKLAARYLGPRARIVFPRGPGINAEHQLRAGLLDPPCLRFTATSWLRTLAQMRA